MADFSIAVQKTLSNEGGFYHNPKTGEYANHGITVWFLRSLGMLHGSGPALPSEITYLQKLTEADAVAIYRKCFWGRIGALDNQRLADKVFDLGVNQGYSAAVMLLQRALNAIYPGAHYAEDGILGPITANAANHADPDKLYAALIDQAAARYRQIAADNPLEANNLNGWLARLRKS